MSQDPPSGPSGAGDPSGASGSTGSVGSGGRSGVDGRSGTSGGSGRAARGRYRRRLVIAVSTGVPVAIALAVLLALLGPWHGGDERNSDDSVGAPAPASTATKAGGGSGVLRPAPSASAGRSTGPPSARWAPRPGQPWQWQLTTPVDQSVGVSIYDIDGFDNDARVVQALHRAGRKVICYIEVGSAEDSRPDYNDWPSTVLGRPNGWPGERWVDIRQINKISGVLSRRFDMCKAKGFDAVEPDLVEGYANDTGFPITASDQLRFNRYVAGLAHQRGMSVALKNDVDQVPQLIGDFDFSIDEQCYEFQECSGLTPFIAAGKAVLHVEYGQSNTSFCPSVRRLGFSSMRKNKGLDAARWPC